MPLLDTHTFSILAWFHIKPWIDLSIFEWHWFLFFVALLCLGFYLLWRDPRLSTLHRLVPVSVLSSPNLWFYREAAGRHISYALGCLPRATDNAVSVCVGKKLKAFVHPSLSSPSFLYLEDSMCLCLFSSFQLLIQLGDFAWIPCHFLCLNPSLLLNHLSIKLVWEPLLIPGPAITSPIPMNPTYVGLSLFLSLFWAPHFLLALLYRSVSGDCSLSLYLICLSTFLLHGWISCFTRLLFSSLSHICLPHIFLKFFYCSVSVAFLSLFTPYRTIYLMSPWLFPGI